MLQCLQRKRKDKDKDSSKVPKVKSAKRLSDGKEEVLKRDKKKRKIETKEDDARKDLKLSALAEKATKRISGARFRWINEKLYTCTSSDAANLFDKDPQLFTLYHEGFREQVVQWPLNPLDHIIEYVKTLPPHAVIADFGCGEAELAKSVPHTVHSFDFVDTNEYVTPCDMSNVPLDDSSVDVGVFCLSLMGTNLIDCFLEARRVIKHKGTLKVYEIQSRIPSVDRFVSQVESVGFKLERKDSLNKMFIDLEFKLKSKTIPRKACKEIKLKPCLYKKR